VAPDDAGVLTLLGAARLGETIGAPMGADGADGAAGAATGSGETAGAGAATRGGAAARRPASVSAIGDIGADSQSSPSNTLPRAIAATAP
jgi:hypothetical protein